MALRQCIRQHSGKTRQLWTFFSGNGRNLAPRIIQDGNYCTGYAAYHGLRKSAIWLRKTGADMEIKNKAGWAASGISKVKAKGDDNGDKKIIL